VKRKKKSFCGKKREKSGEQDRDGKKNAQKEKTISKSSCNFEKRGV